MTKVLIALVVFLGAWMIVPKAEAANVPKACVFVFSYGWEHTVDVPVTGKYDSNLVANQRRVLTDVQGLQPDCVVIDYWPTDHSSWLRLESYINLIRTEFPNLKYSVLIEPGYFGSTHPIDGWIYNNICTRWCGDPQFFTYGGRPLLTTFYERVAGNDPRFGVITFSNSRMPTYNNLWGRPASSVWRITSLMVRYDDSTMCVDRVRVNCQSHDHALTGSVFWEQHGFVMNNRQNLDLVFWYGFNEYQERANFEKHIGPWGYYPPDKGYNWVRDSIYNLRH